MSFMPATTTSRSRALPTHRSDRVAVTFVLNGPRIDIDGDGVDVRITAVVGINPAGECRYFVGELEFLGWEVRKQALDQLFFEDAEE